MCTGQLALDQQLPCDERAPGTARALLRGWMCDQHDGSCLEDGLLLLSEVVTNAVLHAGPPLAVHYDFRGDDTLEIAVHDGSRKLVVDPNPEGELVPGPEGLDIAEHGRGLPLVQVVAADWSCEPDDLGKTVTFSITCGGS